MSPCVVGWRRSWGRAVCALLLVASSAELAACNCAGQSPTEPAELEEGDRSTDPELTLGLPSDVAQRTLAIVDDEPLTVLDVAYELEELSPILQGRAADATRRRVLVDNLVADRALAAEARDRGLDDDPSILRGREEIYVRALVAQVESDVAPPSDEQVRAYYEAHRDRYRSPELRTGELIFTRDRAAATAAITAISGNIRRQPELWMSTAESLGFAGPRRQPRIQIEPIAATPREGEPYVPQEVRDAVFATEPGSLFQEVVPFEDGFYIVRVAERVEAQDATFDQVSARIRTELHAEAVDAYITTLVAEPLSTATFDDAALDSVVMPVAAPAGPSAPTVR